MLLIGDEVVAEGRTSTIRKQASPSSMARRFRSTPKCCHMHVERKLMSTWFSCPTNTNRRGGGRPPLFRNIYTPPPPGRPQVGKWRTARNGGPRGPRSIELAYPVEGFHNLLHPPMTRPSDHQFGCPAERSVPEWIGGYPPLWTVCGQNSLQGVQTMGTGLASAGRRPRKSSPAP